MVSVVKLLTVLFCFQAGILMVWAMEYSGS